MGCCINKNEIGVKKNLFNHSRNLIVIFIEKFQQKK